MTVAQWKTKLKELENRFLLSELTADEFQSQWDRAFDALQLARKLGDTGVAP